MPRLVYDENVAIFNLATAPANLAAPTVAEITAGTEITQYIPKDGLKYGVSNNRVTAGDISTAFTAETMGTWGSQMSITAYRDDTTDTAWDAFQRGTTGALVILPYAGSGATPVAADHAQVIPIECGQPVPMDSAENENQKFTVEMAVTDTPVFDASVAA